MLNKEPEESGPLGPTRFAQLRGALDRRERSHISNQRIAWALGISAKTVAGMSAGMGYRRDSALLTLAMAYAAAVGIDEADGILDVEQEEIDELTERIELPTSMIGRLLGMSRQNWYRIRTGQQPPRRAVLLALRQLDREYGPGSAHAQRLEAAT